MSFIREKMHIWWEKTYSKVCSINDVRKFLLKGGLAVENEKQVAGERDEGRNNERGKKHTKEKRRAVLVCARFFFTFFNLKYLEYLRN